MERSTVSGKSNRSSKVYRSDSSTEEERFSILSTRSTKTANIKLKKSTTKRDVQEQKKILEVIKDYLNSTNYDGNINYNVLKKNINLRLKFKKYEHQDDVRSVLKYFKLQKLL